MIQVRHPGENLPALRQLSLHGGRIGVVVRHVRIPYPHRQPVAVGDGGQTADHFQGLHGHQRAGGVVVRQGRQQLHRVGAEQRKLPHVLIVNLRRPCVIGVGLGPVAQLMSAQGENRRLGHAQPIGKGHVVPVPAHAPQQTAHAVQRAMGIRAQHHGHVPSLLRRHGQTEALPARRVTLLRRQCGSRRRERIGRCGNPDAVTVGLLRREGQQQAGTALDFLLENLCGANRQRLSAAGNPDGRPAEIQPFLHEAFLPSGLRLTACSEPARSGGAACPQRARWSSDQTWGRGLKR